MPNEYSQECGTAEAVATTSRSTAAPSAAGGTLATIASPKDLGGLLTQLERAIEAKGWATHHREAVPYWWEVHDNILLAGLRVAALISLRQLHHWSPEQAEEHLDRWLATSRSEVSVLLACLSEEAMRGLIRRLEAA